MTEVGVFSFARYLPGFDYYNEKNTTLKILLSGEAKLNTVLNFKMDEQKQIFTRCAKVVGM